MAEMGEPLWIPNRSDCSIGFKLNEDEYFQIFPIGFGPRPESLYCESSRHSTTLNISSHSLLDFFMCQANWKCFFSAIVSKATCLEILSNGLSPGNYNGALYYRQVGEKKWVVVDISLDIFREFHLVKSRKRPSGCIIEDMPNRFTNVTWIEHVEAQHVTDVHPIYKTLVSSGLAFRAKRWLGILQSQTDRLFSVMSNTLPFSDITVAMSTESKRSLTLLSERMVGMFNTGVSVAIGNVWNIIPYSGPNKIRVLKIRNTDIPGRPVGVILVATYSKKCAVRNFRNQVIKLKDCNGKMLHGHEEVQKEATSYYKGLIIAKLSNEGLNARLGVLQQIVLRTIDNEDDVKLIEMVSQEEIKNALFMMKGGKSLGPNGYNATFFKENWDII
ncbi:homeobox-leucine zipper protein MERISTEM L1-like [Impatiens glandulifera]|uniref:homeobox-leucine zipper protein MERISTEM L1-like n=1 Tax=Impatiens glandulifera TaxID=253017 RepID=UPI001FB04F56|nr:homeobox-leucine zipper protein MERISTEM L1-like [Impatiens glandulifera]